MQTLSIRLLSLINTLGANLFAAEATDISDKVKELIDQMWQPGIAIMSALAAMWGLFLAFKFWGSGGDERKKGEAKAALLWFLLGILVIFAVAALVPLIIAWLSTWKG